MFPYIQIGSTEILSMYNIMAACGLLAAILSFYGMSKATGIPIKTVDNMSVLIVFIILAAALAAILLNNLEHNHWDFSSPKAFISGFTFYGGLLGGALVAVPGCFLLGEKNQLSTMLLDQLAVSVMIGHALGRVGCFLGGCCYGRPTDSFLGILYPVHGQWIRLYPVQLYESLFLFLLFLYSYRHIANALERYLISYGVFRFMIEFLRGDNRGIHFMLSPSQWISIFLFFAGITLFVIRKQIKTTTPNKQLRGIL